MQENNIIIRQQFSIINNHQKKNPATEAAGPCVNKRLGDIFKFSNCRTQKFISQNLIEIIHNYLT